MITPKEERSPAAVEEIVKGQVLAGQLMALLRQPSAEGEGPEPMVGQLMEGVLGSLSRALAALESGVKLEVSQVLDPSEAGSPEQRSESSSGRKRKVQPAKDRRGGTRRRGNPSSLRKTEAKSLEDGYTWRKYGQKDIFSAKFPRSYFRCSHKHDRGCQATRQVQKSEQDPSMFVIIYMGEHTCMNTTTAAKSLRDSYDGASCLINFGSNAGTAGVETPFSSSLPSLLIRNECDEEVLSSLTPRSSSSSEYSFKPQDQVVGLEGLVVPATEVADRAVSDLGDATSDFLPCAGGLDHDFMASFSMDDLFRFEHDDFFGNLM